MPAELEIVRYQPNEDFYVTSGHIIVYNGVKTKARNIPGAKRVKVKPQSVYSICTENRQPILINNLDVMAYEYEEWLNYAKTHNIAWIDNTLKIRSDDQLE